MNAFGKQLKEVVSSFHLKYASVARVTGYDASYISKWINTDVLPSAHALPQICSALTNLILTSCSEQQIDEFCCSHHFLEFPREQALKNCISSLLTRAFSSTLEDESGNLATPIRPASTACPPVKEPFVRGDRYQTFCTYLRLLSQQSSSLHMTIIGDLPCFQLEDLLFLMDLRTYINTLPFTDGSIHLLISEKSILQNDNARIMVAFMNLLMIPSRIPFQVCRSLIQMTGLIIITDNLLYRAQCRMESQWLVESFSFESREVSTTTTAITAELLPTSRPLFTSCEIVDFHSSSLLSNSYWGKRERQLVGCLDTLYCSEDFLKSLFSVQPEKLTTCLRQHNLLINTLQKGQIHQCILYREALENLTYRGIIQFYGKELCLPVSARLFYLQGLAQLLDQYESLEIRVIDGYVIPEIKHRPLPNIYFSRGSCGFLSFPLDGTSCYCLIHDSGFRHSLEETFSTLWEGHIIHLFDLREVLFEYMDFCQDMLSC